MFEEAVYLTGGYALSRYDLSRDYLTLSELASFVEESGGDDVYLVGWASNFTNLSAD